MQGVANSRHCLNMIDSMRANTIPLCGKHIAIHSFIQQVERLFQLILLMHGIRIISQGLTTGSNAGLQNYQGKAYSDIGPIARV
jgi:hypothetical protein